MVEQTLEGLTYGMTRTEGIALIALLEHIGVPLTTPVATVPAASRRVRTWTRAQKAAHSKRMKAYWRGRNGK